MARQREIMRSEMRERNLEADGRQSTVPVVDVPPGIPRPDVDQAN